MTGNEVSTPSQTALDEIEKLAQEHAGLGTSDREEDKIQAWVKVLHQQSPELNARDPSYVVDGRPGDLWIAAQNLLIKGEEGIWVQQVGYNYAWVEWPGAAGSGGRPINRYPDKPEHLGGNSDTIGRIDLPNGHQIIETRYHLVLIYRDGEPPFAATINYSSTGAGVSQNWTNSIWHKFNADGSKAPAFKYIWHMTTVERSNDKGRWYLLMPRKGEEKLATPEQFRLGLETAQRISANKLQMAEEDATNASIDAIPF